MSGPSATPNTYPYPNEPRWTRSERAIARRVFDAALKQELHEVMEEAKQKAKLMREPADVWDLERYLTQRRKDIDRRYDFRDSRLKDVLGRLLYENRLVEEDLQGLREDKVEKFVLLRNSWLRMRPDLSSERYGLITTVDAAIAAVWVHNARGKDLLA